MHPSLSKNQLRAGRSSTENVRAVMPPRLPAILWGGVAWATALGAFALAAVSSYRQIHYNIPNDLRSPAILALDSLLAGAVALGFAARDGALKQWGDIRFCLRFGVWAAAVFRLVPPCLNEDVLYLRNCGTFDVPYVLFGACVHGALAGLLAYPFARQVLDTPLWPNHDRLWELCGSAVFVFFIVACVVRLSAENWWAGFLRI